MPNSFPESRFQQALGVLQKTFGHGNFRPPQDAIIQCVLGGRDALVLMPTGGGKSLCYQVPALVQPGLGVVISPLIALMEDQVGALRRRNVAAAALHSGLSVAEQEQVEKDLQDGRLKLLYCAPERLLSERTLRLLRQLSINLFAIDEAHCVSQWGPQFRPEYDQLGRLRELFPGVVRIALTASADPQSQQDIQQSLALQNAQVFVQSFDRPNIQYQIQQGGGGKAALLEFLQGQRGAGIVYCLSRRKVEETAQWLCSQGYSALPYHAGMSAVDRNTHQRAFLTGSVSLMVATIAFGMGIDKSDIRFVAHLNLPKNIEAYYQETGRAGRDGKPAVAWLHYGLQDLILLRQMIQGTDASQQQLEEERLQAMLDLTEEIGCRRQRLLGYFGEELPAPCGNCDNCLQPPPQWDASEAAQMALSAAYRSGQRWGVQHLIDILLGRDTPRIQQHRHQQLSVYGIGRQLSARHWQAVFRHLLARGYLLPHLQNSALRLSPKSRALLRGEERIRLRGEVGTNNHSPCPPLAERRSWKNRRQA